MSKKISRKERFVIMKQIQKEKVEIMRKLKESFIKLTDNLENLLEKTATLSEMITLIIKNENFSLLVVIRENYKKLQSKKVKFKLFRMSNLGLIEFTEKDDDGKLLFCKKMEV